MSRFPYTDRLEYIKAPQPISEADTARVREIVAEVRRDVAARGDAALRDYTRKFDGVEVGELRVTDAEIEVARLACDAELAEGTRFAIERITAFAKAQLATLAPLDIEVLPHERRLGG